MLMETCHLCRQPAVQELLDFGPQPVCNRFLAHRWEGEYRHRLAMGVCHSCGLVQLLDPPPAIQLAPRVGWITYNEPEGHLDTLADTLARLPGLTSDAVIAGVTFKDDSTLRRLRDRCFSRTWRIDPGADLGIGQAHLGIETIQAKLNPAIARELVRARGPADVVVARHILEHAHDLHGFLAALRTLVRPEGYVVFELPDARRALERHDYSTVWEEHLCYFSPVTLQHGLRQAGFSVAHFEVYPYSLENSLVAIVRPEQYGVPARPPDPVLRSEIDRALQFARGFSEARALYQRLLGKYRSEQGPTAILGAGHLACAFINLLGLRTYFEFVVDDNPHKQGLLMPGSRLPICGSAALVRRDIGLCLMTVAPESEAKVIGNNQAFLDGGGLVASIFPESKYALPRLMSLSGRSTRVPHASTAT
ncbi:MAG TPA: class I SAM-dependent methyltransferase [Gemmataceae bacterium]|nr:class I SAM-dependent methyltransferase [Gemmataceae bacterium]